MPATEDATGEMTGTAPVGPGRPTSPIRHFRCPLGPKNHVPLRSTRIRAPAGVQYTVLCRFRSSFDGHNTVWGSPGNGLPESVR
jgi:hypothetical protein